MIRATIKGVMPTQTEDRKERFNLEIKIPGGYYESVQTVIREINSSIRKTFIDFGKLDESIWPVFKYQDSSKRVMFTLPRKTSIFFNKTLMTILGVGSSQIHMMNHSSETVSRFGTEVSDINGGIHSLYIYCDLLESVPVGDIEAPLLRVVDGQ